jgi:hypothetical protein
MQAQRHVITVCKAQGLDKACNALCVFILTVLTHTRRDQYTYVSLMHVHTHRDKHMIARPSLSNSHTVLATHTHTNPVHTQMNHPAALSP